MDTAERLRRNMRVEGECWIWTGSTDAKWGYGKTKTGSRTDGSRRSVKAHRLAYETWVGPIPEGLTIDHLCRRPDCINPEHMEPVTMRENTMRGIGPTKLNAEKERCPKCGGEYTERPDRGGRYCRPCALAYFREYNATRRPACSIRLGLR